MHTALSLFILSIGSIFASVFLDKRFEESISFTVLSITFILFIFYMLNIVLIGLYTIFALLFLLLVLSAIKFFKNKECQKKYLLNFFTPGLLIFILLSIIIYYIVKDNYVMYFDELRMWAKYPKSIFYTNRLMLDKSLIFSSDYYPGMPLFQYFWSKCVATFKDSHLYFSYSIFCLSLILPVTKKITWKKFYLIIPSSFLLFMFPMIFANSGFDGLYYYRTLYIDPVIGITFGLSLFLSTRNLKNNWFNYILFALSLSSILLMKIVGLILGSVVILSFLFNQLVIYKNTSLKIKKKFINNYLFLLIPILLFAFTFFSWQNLSAKYGSVNMANSMATGGIKNGINLIFNPQKEDIEFRESYITHINTTPIIVNDLLFKDKLTLPNITLFFAFIMLLLLFSCRKKDKQIILSSIVFSIISILVFLLFYYYIYSTTFNRVILCYGRYISPVLGGISILILYLLFNTEMKNKSISILIYSIITIFLIHFSPKLNNYRLDEQVNSNIIEYSKNINKVLSKYDDEKKIGLIYNSCDTVSYSCIYYEHHLSLDLIEYNIQASGMIISEADPAYYYTLTIENIKSNVLMNDYLFIFENVNNLSKEVYDLFGESLEAGEIFKVDRNEKYKNGFKLIKIS